MTEKHLPGNKSRTWLRSRGVWFWAIAGTLCSIFVLFAGSQIARDRGQTVEWYTGFGQWLGALGSLIAATVALSIATRDRRERVKEREDEEQTHARLVRLTPENSRQAVLVVEVRNFGPLPVLDVTATEASWNKHPTARCPITRQARGPAGREQPILRPWQSDQAYDEMIRFEIQFLHPTKDETLVPRAEENPNFPGFPVFTPMDLSNVVVKIQFTTANGIRWETPTQGDGTGEPVRV